MQWRKDSLFNMWHSENWTATCKIMKSEQSLIPYTKINPKWIKHLRLKTRSYKTPKGKHRQNTLPSDINHSNIWGDLSPQVMEIKAKINK